MSTIHLAEIDRESDFESVLDLAERAADYVVLEVGHVPNADFVDSFFTAVPPDVPPEGLMTFGIMDDTALAGITCVARGYEYPDDWWVGLVLIDPAFRGLGVGHQTVEDIKRRARAEGVVCLKLSVLEANPRALAFWRREGFILHRLAPALPGSDGHNRIVLKYVLDIDAARRRGE